MHRAQRGMATFAKLLLSCPPPSGHLLTQPLLQEISGHPRQARTGAGNDKLRITGMITFAKLQKDVLIENVFF